MTAGATEPRNPESARTVWAAAVSTAEQLAEKLDAANESVSAAGVREKAARQAAVQAGTALSQARTVAASADAVAAAADRRAITADQATASADAELSADQQALDLIANSSVEGAVPVDAESILTASSADNLLDKEQAVAALTQFKQAAMTKAQHDKAGLAAAALRADLARQSADQSRATAEQARDAAAAAKKAADQAVTSAASATETAIGAQSRARQAARASRAQATKAEALFLQLSAQQQVAIAAAHTSAVAQGAALAAADARLQVSTVPGVSGLDATQLQVAKDIAGVALSRGLGKRGVLIGIMTGLTESMLTPVDHGDSATSSSLGVFQQLRGWGSQADRMNPTIAAGLFYDRMVGVANWQSQDPWVVAQTVQGSEFSDGSNYQAQLGRAQSITDAVVVNVKINLQPPTAAPAPDAQAQLAVDYAMMQIGQGYAAGGAGPKTFDASGLAVAAWSQAGVTLPRTASEQAAALKPVPRRQWQPGDVIAYYSPVSHVAVYVGNGMVVSAAGAVQGVVYVPVDQPGPDATGYRVPR